jgi:hypothetical protein
MNFLVRSFAFIPSVGKYECVMTGEYRGHESQGNPMSMGGSMQERTREKTSLDSGKV